MTLPSRVTRRSPDGRRIRAAAPIVAAAAILATVAGTATSAAGQDVAIPSGAVASSTDVAQPAGRTPGTAPTTAGPGAGLLGADVSGHGGTPTAAGSAAPAGTTLTGTAPTGTAPTTAGQIADPSSTAGGADALEALGVKPFLYPSAAPFCNDGSTLGLVPAYAGAVPGPWPRTGVTLPGLDLAAVKSGQTMFAFVPYGVDQDGTDTSGMRVIWWNADTHRAGSATMGTLTDVLGTMIPPQVPPALRPLAEQVVQGVFGYALPVGGIRAVPVETGSGTVLAAVFGSVRNGNRTCWFLPTVGITEVP
ncbi:hypothetical protein [Nocardia sp. BMG111209]|uniref:hypothetical protein n=1 Tax=Nocardia sp. BMG111209 TaxID=1160137 RepID=UPI000377A50F|nr:hypothetical protein [Nocardia sp. BMG111209]